MGSWTLTEIEAAVRAAWGEDTCDPVDLPWSTHNPAKGQCGVTALVLNDLLGGDLMSAKVLFPDGTQQGWHTWNVFGDGFEVDLTLEEFRAGEVVQPPERIVRAPGPPARDPDRYEALRSRVLTALDAVPTRRVLERLEREGTITPAAETDRARAADVQRVSAIGSVSDLVTELRRDR